MPFEENVGFNVIIEETECKEYFYNNKYYIEAKAGKVFKIKYSNNTNEAIVAILFIDGKETKFVTTVTRPTYILPGYYSKGHFKELIFADPPTETVNTSTNTNTSKELTIGILEVKFFKAIPFSKPITTPITSEKPFFEWKQESNYENKKFYLQSLSTKLGNDIESHFNGPKQYKYDPVESIKHPPFKILTLHYQSLESLQIIGVILKESNEDNPTSPSQADHLLPLKIKGENESKRKGCDAKSDRPFKRVKYREIIEILDSYEETV